MTASSGGAAVSTAATLVSYETGDDHFDWTEGYQGRNQFLIALQTTRNATTPGVGGPGSDPRAFEGDGCDPATSGCTLSATAAGTPYSMPVFANFTMVGPGTTIVGYPADGNGGTWRRGTGGVFINGIMARWRGIAINIRDAWTDSLFIGSNGRDSLQITNILLTQNGFNMDTTGAGFAQTANWTGAATTRLASLKLYATTVTADTLLGITLGAAPDWSTKATSPSNTGGGTAPAARVAGYFGGSWVNTTYLGAADNTSAKWWAGWTVYATN